MGSQLGAGRVECHERSVRSELSVADVRHLSRNPARQELEQLVAAMLQRVARPFV